MALTILEIIGMPLDGLEPVAQEMLLNTILSVTGVLIVLFVTMIIDFLARILSRFIPRWNRNS